MGDFVNIADLQVEPLQTVDSSGESFDLSQATGCQPISRNTLTEPAPTQRFSL